MEPSPIPPRLLRLRKNSAPRSSVHRISPIHLPSICSSLAWALSYRPSSPPWERNSDGARLASNSIWPCAILHASHNAFVQVFFTPLTGPRGTVTPYVIDEFGVALPLVATVFAIGFWLQRDRALKRIPSEISTPMAPAAI